MLSFSKPEVDGIALKIRSQDYSGYKVLLHSENDLSDAILINPHSSPHYEQRMNVKLRNKHFSKTSTQSKPCQKHWPKSCHDIHTQKKIAEDYHCQVPLFLTGLHLLENKLPHCTVNVTLEIMSKDYQSNCKHSVPCEYTKYEVKYSSVENIESWDLIRSELTLLYEGPIKEEHYTSSISVDEQTLIGQAGGLLGILLGWSGMTLSDLINPTLNLLLESSFSLE
jgi:hypothetical protein